MGLGFNGEKGERGMYRFTVRRQCITAAALCAVLLFVLTASSLFILFHADHECAGHHCPVCADMRQAAQQAEENAGLLGSAPLPAAGLYFTAFFILLAEFCCQAEGVPSLTLVRQKVRMDN